MAVLRVPMVVTYYIKLFPAGADRHNDILMSLLLLVTETTSLIMFQMSNTKQNTDRLVAYIFLSFNCNVNSIIRYPISLVHKLLSEKKGLALKLYLLLLILVTNRLRKTNLRRLI